MKITVASPITFIDASILKLPREKLVLVSEGTYEVENVSNPYPSGDSDFIVMKGTMIGVAHSHLERLNIVVTTE